MDKLKELLISIFGQEAVDAMTEEQQQAAMEFVESLSDLAEGWQGEDGSVVLDNVKNPSLKDFLTATLSQLDETTGALTAAQGDAEKFKGEAESARSDAETAKGEAEAAKGKVSAVQKQHALNDALKGSGAHNPDLVAKHLDMDKVTIDEEGKVDGLDDQVEALKKSDPYLFKGDGSSDDEDGDSKNSGFNPASSKKKAGWQPGMKIDQAYALQND